MPSKKVKNVYGLYKYLGKPESIVADNGYYSEDNLNDVDDCELTPVRRRTIHF